MPCRSRRGKGWEKTLSWEEQQFTIGIVGVMSAGKTTLLNALLGRALLPARNLATTAAATYIRHDSDAAQFTVRAACTREALEDACFEPADRALLDAWSDAFPFIEIRGCLPFLRDAGIHGGVTLVDTPGPNNSMNERHGLTTRSVLQSGDISLLLYVWNASQLATWDDRNFLREVEAWRQTSPVPELFVLNRMDCFDPEKESLTEGLKKMQCYLAEEEVRFPQIIGTSARMALYFRTREALTSRERGRLKDFVEACGRSGDFYERAYANVDPVLDGAFTELVGTLKREHRMQELSFLNTGVPMLEAVILDHLRRLCPRIVSQKGGRGMHQVVVKHNPYTRTTSMSVDGEDWGNTPLLQHTIGRERLQTWIDVLPEHLKQELNTSEPIELRFYGTPQDCEDVKNCFEAAGGFEVKTESSRAAEPETKREQLMELFEALQKGPFKELRDEALADRFRREMSPKFEIGVIATMSSGKSTLLNAIMGENILPARNEATTAVITRIRHDPSVQNGFLARSAASEEELKEAEFVPASQELLNSWNDEPGQHMFIELEGCLPMFRDFKNALTLVFTDTPGPNSSTNAQHEECTMRLLEGQEQAMILYVLNGQQLGISDDARLLDNVRRLMESGGRQGHDRFLFVLNQMDAIDPDNGESISRTVENAVNYLAGHDIRHPVYVCASGVVARTLRCPHATRKERRLMDDFCEETEERDALHLERFTNASLWVRREVEGQMERAEHDTDRALVHSGIPTIEAIIREYLYKHALPMKIAAGYNLMKGRFDALADIAGLETEFYADKEEFRKLSQEIKIIKERQKDRAFMDFVIQGFQKMTVSDFTCYNDMNGRIDQMFADFETELGKYSNKIYSQQGAEQVRKEILDLVRRNLDGMGRELRSTFSEIKFECQKIIMAYYTEYMTKLGEGSSFFSSFLKDMQNNFFLDLQADVKGIGVYSSKETKYVGTRKERDGIWYNPFSWFRYKEVPVYETVTVYETARMINDVKALCRKKMIEANQAFDQASGDMMRNIINNAVEKINAADAYIREKFDSLDAMNQDKETMRRRINELDDEIRWLKRMDEKLSTVLEV